MDGELVYEIARYSPRGEEERLCERAQVLRRGETLWRRGADGLEVACPGGEVAALISADPSLGEVHPNEVTRVQANQEALRNLPLVLSAPGGGEAVDRSLWSDGMWEKHIEEAESAQERGVHRVLYVNGARWPVFSTSEGERFLPEDPDWWGTEPLLSPRWGELRFTETDSRTSGTDRTAIGLVTPGVVACITRFDESQPEDVELARRGDDAAAFVGWLLDGSLSTNFSVGEELLAQLFVEASTGGHNGEAVPGSRLVEVDQENPIFGCYDSSEWTLQLELEPPMVDAILDVLADRSPRIAEIVEAARNPESPAGLARKAWLEQWEQDREAA
ncbi:hypothetical protein GA0070624_3239 [Micromonospora rhizosphaerae]|uniref:Uncharacterized protein n=1 Tax=Micromonospora rhizosphaerae TaxID=568872 RepID=A0A1C6S9D0_9ACTN|nr:hypothetical protein [Micromonospora rhizosphaerae]SCL26107.1 hypothetical protein GA0070624_3239 [Micromonospora rhizosphaerae]